MSNEEHNDPVWDLLKRAKKVDVDPFFSRNVSREVRGLQATSDGNQALAPGASERSGPSKLISWFFRPAPILGSLAAAAAVALLLMVTLPDDKSDGPGVDVAGYPSKTSELALQDEIDDITYLDEIVSQKDVTSLDDHEILALLF